MGNSTESNLVADTQEHLDDTVVTQEPTVEEEANQGEKEEADIHELVVETTVTQEPMVET